MVCYTTPWHIAKRPDIPFYTPCSGMFTVILFTKVRKWKQPKTTFNKSMDNENMVHIFNGILFTCKKNDIMNFQVNGKTWKRLH